MIWTESQHYLLEKAVEQCTNSRMDRGHVRKCTNWDRVSMLIDGGSRTGSACHQEYLKFVKAREK